MKYLLAFCTLMLTFVTQGQELPLPDSLSKDTTWLPWETYPEDATEEELILLVDKSAAFPGGGYLAMFEFIKKNLSYPQPAYYRRIQGTVFVRVLITETGKLEDIRLWKGLEYSCNEEALRIIRKMPDWESALREGCPVKRKMVIPVTFELPKISQSGYYSSGKPY
jgi:TonB family protein